MPHLGATWIQGGGAAASGRLFLWDGDHDFITLFKFCLLEEFYLPF